jgi:hypothetical protein
VSASIKTAEGFEDKHGFFEAFTQLFWKVAKENKALFQNFNLKHADGKITFTISVNMSKDEGVE